MKHSNDPLVLADTTSALNPLRAQRLAKHYQSCLAAADIHYGNTDIGTHGEAESVISLLVRAGHIAKEEVFIDEIASHSAQSWIA